MRIAVVGAGPGGSLAAWQLARDGADVTVFDHSHPREKPCGGGLTAKALALLPEAPDDDPLPARQVDACAFESGEGEGVRVLTDAKSFLWPARAGGYIPQFAP